MTLEFPELTSPIRLYVERDGKTVWSDYPPSMTKINLETKGARILLAELDGDHPKHAPVLIFDDSQSGADKVPQEVRDETRPCCEEAKRAKDQEEVRR